MNEKIAVRAFWPPDCSGKSFIASLFSSLNETRLFRGLHHCARLLREPYKSTWRESRARECTFSFLSSTLPDGLGPFWALFGTALPAAGGKKERCTPRGSRNETGQRCRGRPRVLFGAESGMKTRVEGSRGARAARAANSAGGTFRCLSRAFSSAYSLTWTFSPRGENWRRLFYAPVRAGVGGMTLVRGRSQWGFRRCFSSWMGWNVGHATKRFSSAKIDSYPDGYV